mmetsp:Transcript_4559/g.16040  ORF Transcript_4559/g.16040 Transcript_4559/m.16040 type:complete len:253 (+) Transcript_4559:131-889(+)
MAEGHERMVWQARHTKASEAAGVEHVRRIPCCGPLQRQYRAPHSRVSLHIDACNGSVCRVGERKALWHGRKEAEDLLEEQGALLEQRQSAEGAPRRAMLRCHLADLVTECRLRLLTASQRVHHSSRRRGHGPSSKRFEALGCSRQLLAGEQGSIVVPGTREESADGVLLGGLHAPHRPHDCRGQCLAHGGRRHLHPYVTARALLHCSDNGMLQQGQHPRQLLGVHCRLDGVEDAVQGCPLHGSCGSRSCGVR